MKIKDERFIRYIVRMLKAGVLSNGELRKTDEGSPQGSIVSPVLSITQLMYGLKRL
jgi:retron-type reverse transcriptase